MPRSKLLVKMANGEVVQRNPPRKRPGLRQEWAKTETLPGEQWKPIAGHEGYYDISTLGRVRALPYTDSNGYTWPLRMRKTPLCTYGYPSVGLYLPQKTPKITRIHILIARAFIPNPEGKPEINHKNGVRHDNRIENLEWCTRKENIVHSYQVLKRPHTKVATGTDNWNAKLTEEKVLQILADSKRSLNKLAVAFGVSKKAILLIKQGKNWNAVYQRFHAQTTP